MPLGQFEREVLSLLAQNRNPDSFVARATVLHQAPNSPRASRDIDVFHDLAESIATAVGQDASVLKAHGYAVELAPPQPSFQRGVISRENHQTKIEWLYDSAFRFFPIEPDREMGFKFNFWDAATNKLLALAGRNEVRDYVDVIWLHQNHLSLGALAWAACGKDAGLTPDFILEEAQRNSRFSPIEIGRLDLVKPLDFVDLKRQWLQALAEAKTLVKRLPMHEIGCLYLNSQGVPIAPDPQSSNFSTLKRHFGSIRGAWPSLRQ